jgi:ABC-type multidrug transport system permease subunit
MRTSSAVAAASTFPLKPPRLNRVLTLVRREYASRRTYRLAFLLDLMFGIANLLVYYFISRTLEVAADSNLGVSSYFAYVLVGIAITNVIGSASTGLAYRVREEQFTGTLEALMVQPVTLTELSAGLAGYPFLFSMGRAAVYILVGGSLLGIDFGRTDWFGFVTMLLVSALAFGSLGIILGGVMLVVKRGEALVGLFTYALGILGGAFFPISTLPDWLQPIARIVPTRFAFEGLRRAIFLGEDWANDAVILLLIGIISFPLANYFFARAVDHTRRAGTLTQY